MTLPFSKYRLFTFFGLFWVFLIFLSVALAVAGFFYKEIFVAFTVVYGLFFLFVAIRSWRTLYDNLKFLPVLILSLVFIFFLLQNATPTVFSGRDQGSLSEAAIRLSQNHNLYSTSPAIQEFYKIYGPGLALNFPGFNYTSDGSLVTHFPLGYISWLAVFYSFFGLNGLAIANSVSLLLFFLCFYLVARMYLSSSFSSWAWILAVSSFLFSWFFKFTLSENLALMLFWFALWEFLLFVRRRKRLYLLSAFLAFIILAFLRIEALAIIPIVILIIGFKYKGEKLTGKPVLLNWMVVPIILAVVLFAYSIKINQPFYVNLAKGFLNTFHDDEVASPASFSFISIFYLLKILGIYAVLNYIILSLLGILYFIKEKRFSLLIPFLISLPAWVYLVNPSVSPDHPWMLRRFLFAVLPMAILYLIIFLQKFFTRKFFAYAIIILFFAANLFVTARYFTFWENKNLLEEIKEIGANFSPNDLILVDREATGDGWTMMTGPLNVLYGKQAVYFMNPSDIDKIDTSRFSNVYLVIPDKNQNLYNNLSDRLTFRREYRVELDVLDVKTGKKQEIFASPVGLPKEKIVVTYGKIYQLNK